MKKVFLFLLLSCMSFVSIQVQAYQQEKLGRAPVAVLTSKGVLVSWRSLVSDASDLGFNVYRDGVKLNSEIITTSTNFMDDGGTAGADYTIESTAGESFTVKAWDSMYRKIAVTRPPNTKDASGSLTGRYRPDEASIGDIDGDGEFELIIKWLPENQRDSGKEGKASPTYITCNEMDGTQLWRINLGHNIRSGNHTMTFLVYDFDGDGKAEMICRTAAGSTDGTGKYVSEAGASDIQATDNSKTYQNSNGYITGGEEFLTVFNGATGAAMHTIWYRPNRGFGDSGAASLNSSWGDSSGNRSERFNAAVAYLDGQKPTAILQRGYYTRCYIWAVDWNGTSLTTRWLHRGTGKSAWDVIDGSGNTVASGTGQSSYGQGVHGISIGDVNADGTDDICIGSATISNEGKLLCSTGKGHGDAIHLADLVPDRPGLEVMMPHEESPYGYDVHDATTGELLASATSSADNGRGLACDFIPSHKGSEFWSSADNNIYACEDGTVLATSKPDTNFRIYWTGDPYSQTFDGRYDSDTGIASPRIRAWNTASNKIAVVQNFADYGQPQTSNTTKATPMLLADFLGDWREEIIMWEYEADWSSKTCNLLIFSTPQETKYRVPCLLQDHQYRMAVAWQNASYNQPPHLSYSLADKLGIDGSTYKTDVVSTAPSAVVEDPSGTGTEKLAMPAEDKGIVTGTCYTAGANQEITASESGGYIKMRTGNNGSTITFTVNEGYAIIAIAVEGRSNNNSTTADRSIYMTDVVIDGATSVLTSPVTFPGGTAGTGPAECYIDGFRALQNIVLKFDNSNIVSSDVDSAGKNKQLYAMVTFTYEKVNTDGIDGVQMTETLLTDGEKWYNLNGQRVSSPVKGIYIKNGKKIIK